MRCVQTTFFEGVYRFVIVVIQFSIGGGQASIWLFRLTFACNFVLSLILYRSHTSLPQCASSEVHVHAQDLIRGSAWLNLWKCSGYYHRFMSLLVVAIVCVLRGSRTWSGLAADVSPYNVILPWAVYFCADKYIFSGLPVISSGSFLPFISYMVVTYGFKHTSLRSSRTFPGPPTGTRLTIRWDSAVDYVLLQRELSFIFSGLPVKLFLLVHFRFCNDFASVHCSDMPLQTHKS